MASHAWKTIGKAQKGTGMSMCTIQAQFSVLDRNLKVDYLSLVNPPCNPQPTS